jgi:hypothetical protein
MDLGFLQGFALRDQGDEADLLHLPRGSGMRQRRPTAIVRLGPSLVTSGAASDDKNGTSELPTFPSCSLTDPIASRDGERSNLSRLGFGVFFDLWPKIRAQSANIYRGFGTES